MDRLLKLWSYITNPLFIPSLVSLWYFINVSNNSKIVIEHKMHLILLFTALIPVIVFAILRVLGMVSSVNLTEIKQRMVPLSVYLVLLYMVINTAFSDQLDTHLYYYFVGVLLASMVALSLVIVAYKISLHMMGMGGIIGFALLLNSSTSMPSSIIIALLFIIAGLTATSRLHLKAHRGHELLFGFSVGLISQVIGGSYGL